MNNILQVSNVCKTYRKGNSAVNVLKNVTFEVPQSYRAVITGESGSGKTTLLSLISGLDNIDSGEIRIGEKNIPATGEQAKAKFRLYNIGFVFQYHFLLPDFTALENVMIPLIMKGTHKKYATEEATLLLQQVGLKERLTHYPAQLSGGECQRVAIARALVNKPMLVLADEPTGALDARNSELIRDILCTLVTEQESTLLIATHDKDFLRIADTHWNLLDGVIQQLV